MECISCDTFSKIKGKCLDNRMGETPEYYTNPKWMGCSDWKDPKENQQQLSLDIKDETGGKNE